MQEPEAQPKVEEDEEMINTESKQEEPSTGCKGKRGGKRGDHMNRKALKNLIQMELEKQSKHVFKQIVSEHNVADQNADEESKDGKTGETDGQVVHKNVVCNGCGVNPIVGIRYKCAVRKNFDFCASCEEMMPSNYPFLKIKDPS